MKISYESNSLRNTHGVMSDTERIVYLAEAKSVCLAPIDALLGAVGMRVTELARFVGPILLQANHALSRLILDSSLNKSTCEF